MASRAEEESLPESYRGSHLADGIGAGRLPPPVESAVSGTAAARGAFRCRAAARRARLRICPLIAACRVQASHELRPKFKTFRHSRFFNPRRNRWIDCPALSDPCGLNVRTIVESKGKDGRKVCKDAPKVWSKGVLEIEKGSGHKNGADELS